MTPLLLQQSQFGSVALIALSSYIVLLVVLGVVGYLKGSQNEEDYYLAGRQQGWIVSSLTIMATFFSSFALLGAPGLVYREGVVFALFALNVPLAALTIVFIGKRISALGRRRGHVTPADMISEHYGSPVALRLIVALVCTLYAVPYIVMQLQAGGIIAQVWFPESERAATVGKTTLAAVTMLYVLFGGMRSVAWTDLIQGILLFSGMLLAGAATVHALGGIDGFVVAINDLPKEALTLPGATGSWPMTKLFTVCLFGAVGSMLQPAQWMRYYAARSGEALNRSALLFGTVLPTCFLFGVMLVGLGGRALYPPRVADDGTLLPHAAVGETASNFDNILIVVLTNKLPEFLGAAGIIITAIVVVAIMAASMSTADSNLHALSAIFTRDVYGRYLRRNSGQRERTWVGRAVIVIATLVALGLIAIGSNNPKFNPVALIAQMGLLAIAFSSQLLPIVIDIFFIRRGTRAGAIAGLITGVATVLLFTPLVHAFGSDGLAGAVGAVRSQIDIGTFALLGNVVMFALVSCFTTRK